MSLDNLTQATDEELAALERQRSLGLDDCRKVDAERRRRRQSRLGMGTPPDSFAPPATATLGDVERIATVIDRHLAEVAARVGRLRFWLMLAPIVWVGVAAATWWALQLWAPNALRAFGIAFRG